MNDDRTYDERSGDLLARATEDLMPDVDRLVAAGVRRGRRLRRRRTLATGLGVLTSAAVVGTLAVLAVNGGGGSDHAVDPASATPSPSSSGSASASSSPTSDGPRQLAVTGRTIPEAFARLHPGSVRLTTTKEVDSPDPIIDFTWNGFAVRVGLTSDSYVTGTRVPDPMRRCLAEGGGPAPCTTGPDGTVVQQDAFTGPAVDGGVTVRMVTVFRPDGWDVMVSAANAASSKDATVLAPEPPFTLAQLVDVAESDVWFR